MIAKNNYNFLEDRYDELRREILNGNPLAGLGLSIILRKGLVNWTQAWLFCMQPKKNSERPDIQNKKSISLNKKQELLQILSTMVQIHCENNYS